MCVQAEEGSTQYTKELKAAKQEAEAAQHSETATQAALKKVAAQTDANL